jgi:hypothetical protein
MANGALSAASPRSELWISGSDTPIGTFRQVR